jgi:ketosteroid isomerase-like protein
MTTRARVTDWLREYERAWRAPGTEALERLFTDRATYRLEPYDAPIEGLEAIAAMWERERGGPDEQFTMRSELVAVDGDVAVVRVEVEYAGPPAQEYRDLWIIEFDAQGRCRSFEEWPFWPERPRMVP